MVSRARLATMQDEEVWSEEDCAALIAMATKALDTERDAALGRIAKTCDPAVLEELVGDCQFHMLAPYDRTCDALNELAAQLRAEGGV